MPATLPNTSERPSMIRIEPELRVRLRAIAPDWLPPGLATRVAWLVGQFEDQYAAPACVRQDLIDRLRTRCPPSYVQADPTTLVNWAVGRYLDILDRYYAERAERITPEVADPHE